MWQAGEGSRGAHHRDCASSGVESSSPKLSVYTLMQLFRRDPDEVGDQQSGDPKAYGVGAGGDG